MATEPELLERALECVRAQADELRRSLDSAMTRVRWLAMGANAIPVEMLDEVGALEHRIGTLVWIEMQIEATP